ncbi:hypothetical protein K493DRAFT_352708 [Basidiobolus meristosporus CBS 931.73]|uniref:Uncharacterized protein n=1 Tax=Basidiobolus meristosporus CBS 931.73 TaxID=1314790 RepID=A0A1Y1Y854_9FUNG|nr:hypothetical protein K493DRAFT_352708 [Basidiobolus meristosporus CBS 931.73]|eukprot:ORX94197.1 hypothetical protein K493DRAFT_352708 [Basidiobolus meristosporus CBS 931.73]
MPVYGLTDTCVDSPRKARKKGVKRGPYKRRKALGKGMENKAGRQTGAVMVDAKTTPFTQAQVNMEPSQASGLAPAPYFARPSAFSPVPSQPLFEQANPRISSDSEYEQVDSVGTLMNPQNQELQRPQARRFSVELPLLSKVDVMPRASSVDRNYHSDYHHELRQNQNSSELRNIKMLTIELPSIATITSRVREREVKVEGGARRRSISPSESENSLPASPIDLALFII